MSHIFNCPRCNVTLRAVPDGKSERTCGKCDTRWEIDAREDGVHHQAIAPAAHAFERAGLGRAPFKVLGVEYRVGPIRVINPKTGQPTGVEIGSPGQPMGCCAYCSQGIMECWVIKSSDGKVFDVGCDCVRKTGDCGLRKALAPLKTARRNESMDKRIEVARHVIAKQEAHLRRLPSPNALRAERGETFLDWAEWMLKHAGRAGRMRVVKALDLMSFEMGQTT